VLNLIRWLIPVFAVKDLESLHCESRVKQARVSDWPEEINDDLVPLCNEGYDRSLSSAIALVLGEEAGEHCVS
jgi:hypothetical protein